MKMSSFACLHCCHGMPDPCFMADLLALNRKYENMLFRTGNDCIMLELGWPAYDVAVMHTRQYQLSMQSQYEYK